jgi:predicted alpha/beta-fold hydrolase
LAKCKAETPIFHFNTRVKAFKKLFRETKLGSLRYRPYFLSPVPLLQFIVYLITEVSAKIFKNPKYLREEFDLKDGGLMAIDWVLDRDGTAYPVLDKTGCPTKPILLLIPGLSGGNNNLYTLSVLRKAQK